MQKPTKKQLVDRITYYEAELNTVLSSTELTLENVRRKIERILLDAPSLEPVPPKTSFPVLTDPDQVEDPEAPAVH